MLGLFCLVEGFPDGGGDEFLTSPVDYKNCSFSDDPEGLNLLGNGVTWEARVKKILEFNCGGCHVGEDPQGGLNLVGDGVYDRLLGASEQIEGMNLIEPGDADNSYLYLKLIGDDRIEGKIMPYNPLTGEGMLNEAELADVLTWITNGAVEDE
ncbi:MAG: c-type cytochrome domain-containing protein [Myxococcota bacterium]